MRKTSLLQKKRKTEEEEKGRKEKKKRKREGKERGKLWSAHQEARINKRRRVSAGENCEWLSFLFVFSFVLVGWIEF